MTTPLHRDQRKVLGRLRQTAEELRSRVIPRADALFSYSPPTAAVVGARGIGKSTILSSFRNELGTDDGEVRLIPTRILDAAVVREDLGLAAAVLQELYDTFSVVDPKNRRHADFAAKRPSLERSPEVNRRDLEESFERCMQSVLVQEESHRRLAQELAMSPGHYGKIVRDATYEGYQLRSVFGKFIDSLTRVHLAHRPVEERSGHGEGRSSQICFVVLVDDLDLGPRRTVHHWLRSLLTDYCDVRVIFILAFDREHLLQLLVRATPEPRFPTNGEALLNKVVPTHRQHELRRWSFAERRRFLPLECRVPEPSNLEELVVQAGRVETLSLLPSHPRALDGVYRWFDRRLPFAVEGGDGSEGGEINAAKALRQIALASGEGNLVRLLDERGSLVANAFSWESQLTLPPFGFKAVIDSARLEEPLWGLPLPLGFREIVTGPEPEAFLEALLDLALAEGRVTPFQLLQQIPFLASRRESFTCRLRFPEPEVIRYFKQEHHDNSLVAAVLPWQAWSEEADQEQFWTVNIGVLPLVEACYGLRSYSPESLFKALFIPPIVTRTGGRGRAESLLPNRFRALLLFVDGLLQSPWKSLESALRFWRPLTFTRFAAAFTLAALVRHRAGSEMPEMSKLMDLTPRNHDESGESLSEEAVEGLFSKLLGRLQKSNTPETSPTSLQALTEVELTRSLNAFLGLPAVTRLAARKVKTGRSEVEA